MSKRKTYHVTPNTDGGWKVKEENSSRALSKHDTKADAINRAKEAAKNQELGQVVIHKKDRPFRFRLRFGISHCSWSPWAHPAAGPFVHYIIRVHASATQL